MNPGSRGEGRELGKRDTESFHISFGKFETNDERRRALRMALAYTTGLTPEIPVHDFAGGYDTLMSSRHGELDKAFQVRLNGSRMTIARATTEQGAKEAAARAFRQWLKEANASGVWVGEIQSMEAEMRAEKQKRDGEQAVRMSETQREEQRLRETEVFVRAEFSAILPWLQEHGDVGLFQSWGNNGHTTRVTLSVRDRETGYYSFEITKDLKSGDLYISARSPDNAPTPEWLRGLDTYRDPRRVRMDALYPIVEKAMHGLSKRGLTWDAEQSVREVWLRLPDTYRRSFRASDVDATEIDSVLAILEELQQRIFALPPEDTGAPARARLALEVASRAHAVADEERRRQEVERANIWQENVRAETAKTKAAEEAARQVAEAKAQAADAERVATRARAEAELTPEVRNAIEEKLGEAKALLRILETLPNPGVEGKKFVSALAPGLLTQLAQDYAQMRKGAELLKEIEGFMTRCQTLVTTRPNLKKEVPDLWPRAEGLLQSWRTIPGLVRKDGEAQMVLEEGFVQWPNLVKRVSDGFLTDPWNTSVPHVLKREVADIVDKIG